MNKEQFLNELKVKINKLPYFEVEKVLNFYDESISDRVEGGESEEEVIAKLGDVETIAKEILLDIPMSEIIGKKVKDVSKNTNNKGLLIGALIVGFPIWFPILISIIAVVFSIYVTIWALVISLYAVLLSFFVAGIFTTVFGIFSIFNQGFLQGLAISGAGLVVLGLGFLTTFPLIKLSKGLVSMTGSVTKGIKKAIIGKKGNK